MSCVSSVNFKRLALKTTTFCNPIYSPLLTKKKTISKFIHVRRPHPCQFSLWDWDCYCPWCVQLFFYFLNLFYTSSHWILCIFILFHSVPFTCLSNNVAAAAVVYFLSLMFFCFSPVTIRSVHQINCILQMKTLINISVLVLTNGLRIQHNLKHSTKQAVSLCVTEYYFLWSLHPTL